jgi:hypothetical protein
MSQVTELVTNFRFEGSTGPLNEYNSSLGSSIGLLAAMTTALFASGAAVATFATNILRAFDATEQLSRSTGEGVEFIQEMGFAASVNGSSIQAFQSSVEGLSRTIGEAAQKGSDDFARLGISVRDANGQVKSTQQVMDEVRNSFSRLGLSMSEQRGFAEALGIDASMLQTLGLTSAAMADLRQQARDLGVLTGEQADQAIAYNDSVTVLRYGLNSLQLLMSVGLAPQLQEISEYFTELLKNNKEWIVEGVEGSFKVLVEFGKMLVRLSPFIIAYTGFVLSASAATGGFALALKGLQAVTLVGLIVGLALAIDDLIVAFQGGESVFRDYFKDNFNIDITTEMHDIVDDVSEMFDDLLILARQFKKSFEDIFSGLGDIIAGEFGKGFGKISGSMNNMVDDTIDFVLKGKDDESQKTPPGLSLGGLQTGDTLSPGLMALSMFEVFTSLLRGDFDEKSSVDQSLLPGGKSGTINNGGSSVEQNISMEIKTNDPERAGQAAANGLQQQLQDARTNARRRGTGQ